MLTEDTVGTVIGVGHVGLSMLVLHPISTSDRTASTTSLRLCISLNSLGKAADQNVAILPA